MIGAIIFVTSDCTIIVGKYITDISLFRNLYVMPSYCLAQLMIILGLLEGNVQLERTLSLSTDTSDYFRQDSRQGVEQVAGKI